MWLLPPPPLHLQPDIIQNRLHVQVNPSGGGSKTNPAAQLSTSATLMVLSTSVTLVIVLPGHSEYLRFLEDQSW